MRLAFPTYVPCVPLPKLSISKAHNAYPELSFWLEGMGYDSWSVNGSLAAVKGLFFAFNLGDHLVDDRDVGFF